MCFGGTELDVYGFDRRRVTDMRDMFYICSNLKKLWALWDVLIMIFTR